MYGTKVHAIGIDVGTSKCCVAAVRNGKVEVFENERGKKTTPSIVAFTNTMRLVGDEAKDQWTLNPLNTVTGIKRILGKPYEDLGNSEKRLPFVVDKVGNPRIAVEYRQQPKTLLPEQILAMILTRMQEIAEFNLGYKVDKAVISVPTCFDERQRQATMDAATIAGLQVLKLINEPTAAAITYRDNKGSCDETLLVLDYGGGTLDSGLVRIDDAKVELLSAYGWPTIGGIDLDNLLANHYAVEFAREKRHKIEDDVKAMTKLRQQCERQKHTLTLLTSPVSIQIDCLVKDIDLLSNIRRDRFQMDVCDTYLSQTLFPALDSAVQKSGATRVVLVGGSTRIPFVQEHLQKNGIILDKSVNLEEAVAHGAALQAALLVEENSIGELIVIDSVGVTVCADESKLKVLIDQENNFRRDEENEKLRIVAMNELEKSCLASNNDDIRNKFLNWLDENPMATREEFMEKKMLVDGPPSPVDPPPETEHRRKHKRAPDPSPKPADNIQTTNISHDADHSEKSRDKELKKSKRPCLPCCIIL